MTDKVQKIREEVERLQNELIQEKKKGFGSDVDDACILELQNVLTYIDSLQQDQSTTEDLGEYINELSKQFPEVSFAKLSRIAVRVAKWQKEEMTAKATDAKIGLPYENKDGGYTHLIDVSRPLPVGNNKIAIIFKED